MNVQKPHERSAHSAGGPTRAMLDARVRQALRDRDDPIALADGPLASLPVVSALVEERFHGRTCAEGLALRAFLNATLEEIALDLEGSHVGSLAAGLRAGQSQATVARRLGTSEEWLCRRFKPQLVRLVRERLEANVPVGAADRAALCRPDYDQPRKSA